MTGCPRACAERTQLALTFASVSTDRQIKYRPTRQRDDRANSGQRKTQSGFLVVDLRIGGLIRWRVRHRYRRSIKHVDAPAFPQPCGIDLLVQHFSDTASDTREELLGQTISGQTLVRLL